MTPTRYVTLALVCGVATLSTNACSRDAKKSAPAAEMQSQTPVQQANTPMSVTGCLRAGDASDTFVLTTGQTTEEDTATYQLIGGPTDQLREQIGKRIEVSGVMAAQQSTESLSMANKARRAKGTSGTPTVSTSTEVEMRQLNVQSVRPLGDRCEMR